MGQLVVAFVSVHWDALIQLPDLDGLLNPPTCFVCLALQNFDVVPVHQMVVFPCMLTDGGLEH